MQKAPQRGSESLSETVRRTHLHYSWSVKRVCPVDVSHFVWSLLFLLDSKVNRRKAVKIRNEHRKRELAPEIMTMTGNENKNKTGGENTSGNEDVNTVRTSAVLSKEQA